MLVLTISFVASDEIYVVHDVAIKASSPKAPLSEIIVKLLYVFCSNSNVAPTPNYSDGGVWLDLAMSQMGKGRRGERCRFQIYVDYCQEKATSHGGWLVGEITWGKEGRMGRRRRRGEHSIPTFLHFRQLSGWGWCLIDFVTKLDPSKKETRKLRFKQVLVVNTGFSPTIIAFLGQSVSPCFRASYETFFKLLIDIGFF